VGVWPEGEFITFRFAGAGLPENSRGAGVLDYGCMPGAEADLIALLSAWGTALMDNGLTGLTCFTSSGARLSGLVLSLPGEHSPFDFWTPGIPEPPGAASRGLYVDHIYF